MDHQSVKNQSIIGKFVDREVKACMTSEVEYILSQDSREAPFSWDDVENYYQPHCDDCGEGYNSFTQEENDDGETVYKCDDCGRVYTEDEYNDLETEPAEVYEWWLVTEWLAKRLNDKKECVILNSYNSYWGRQGSGQAILLDGVMGEICEEIDGQAYDWGKQ